MDNNKDYIINIRVSKDTLNKLKSKAKENSQSLSDLVRKTLDDSWEIFGDLKKDLFNSDAKTGEEFEYYQKIILAKDSSCYLCKSQISKGTEAFLGTSKTGIKKYFCNTCLTN